MPAQGKPSHTPQSKYKNPQTESIPGKHLQSVICFPTEPVCQKPQLHSTNYHTKPTRFNKLLGIRTLNIIKRVRKIRRKQICRRKTRLRNFLLIGKRQCTPKGQARYVNVRGSVQWRRVFLWQTFLRRIFLVPS